MGISVEPTARHPAKTQSNDNDAATRSPVGRGVSPTPSSRIRVDVDVEKLGEQLAKGQHASSPKRSKGRDSGGGGKGGKKKGSNKRVPLYGYILLLSALLALSSLGAALKLQGPSVTPTMKAYWRMVATAISLLPFAARSVHKDGFPRLSHTQWRNFAACAAGYATMTTAFAVSLSMSSMAETFILGNTGSLVIIAGKMLLRKPVLLAEGLGAAVGFLGGVICALDTPSAASHGAAQQVVGAGEDYHPVLGGLIAFLASCALSVYLVLAKDLRPHVDLFMFILCLMTMASTYLLLYMFLSGEEISLSAHHEHGLWGWTNLTRDRLPIEIHLAVVCNLIGTTGYVACMRYFDAVVVSTVMLMEPLTATLMGTVAGVDDLPGVQTWVGGAIVTSGSLLVILADARRTEVKPHTQ